ncbi:tyrosine-protein phosphatase [Christiangramia sp. SM2212]|uniref:protein-tyrosine-phosphatase n=1 Tax=Christiangramia sediminicola TaxID=3073267 RepID=A0ABU1EQW6_9FLAO|nr:CpsB/CapC family capsule biosynthesis tyrosine phosphatase [Christiangramia sp. SM2212]MDR5590558.1 CpsB/CapC family capsule biosynthesis tyrosine phosphatase [Christiangramia sp. SM2212]
MLSIFQKKTFLIDLIEGITDFHNHILPGIDDGAKTTEDSLELINEFQNIGITDFVATPHVIGEYYPNTPESIENAFQKIQPHISNKVNFNYSAEYMMDQHFVEIIEKQKILPIIKNKVLVEMSYFQPPINLNEILFKLQNNSYSPILAHPERYTYWHSKNLEKLKQIKTRGCSFQLNMLSLSNHYGIGIQKIAFRLLENNLIDFISSDAHKISHLDKIKEIKIPKKILVSLEKVIENNRNLFSS